MDMATRKPDDTPYRQAVPLAFTVQETAKLLNISERTVRRMISLGRLGAYRPNGKILRIRKEEVYRVRNEDAIGSH